MAQVDFGKDTANVLMHDSHCMIAYVSILFWGESIDRRQYIYRSGAERLGKSKLPLRHYRPPADQRQT